MMNNNQDNLLFESEPLAMIVVNGRCMVREAGADGRLGLRLCLNIELELDIVPE